MISSRPVRVVALLASHNRCERTVACLSSLFSQRVPGEIDDIGAVLVDGGSTDQTVAAVRAAFSRIEVVEGPSSLYWAGAMEAADRIATRGGIPDYLLWLNDDVVLDEDALQRLLTTVANQAERCIAVGACRDPVKSTLTYSGVARTGRHPLRMRMVPPSEIPVRAETFNGNVVLVPRSVREAVGPIDGGFVHSAADFDYGHRARRAGIHSMIAPGTVATCARDGDRKPWTDPSLSVARRVGNLLGPKGHPPRQRARYLRRHGGFAWPLLWCWSYLRALPEAVLPRKGIA